MQSRPRSATIGPGRSRSKAAESTAVLEPEGLIMVPRSSLTLLSYAASKAFRAARQSASSTVSPDAVMACPPRSSVTQ